MKTTTKKPALTLVQAKKQIATLKGKVTNLENALDVERAERVFAQQQQKATYESRERLYNEMKVLEESYDHLSTKNKELSDKFNQLQKLYDEKFTQAKSYFEDNIFLIKERNKLQNELKTVQLVSDNWKKNYLELQEEIMNRPWNRLKTWFKTF